VTAPATNRRNGWRARLTTTRQRQEQWPDHMSPPVRRTGHIDENKPLDRSVITGTKTTSAAQAGTSSLRTYIRITPCCETEPEVPSSVRSLFRLTLSNTAKQREPIRNQMPAQRHSSRYRYGRQEFELHFNIAADPQHRVTTAGLGSCRGRGGSNRSRPRTHASGGSSRERRSSGRILRRRRTWRCRPGRRSGEAGRP
jgi:hypothetical protein